MAGKPTGRACSITFYPPPALEKRVRASLPDPRYRDGSLDLWTEKLHEIAEQIAAPQWLSPSVLGGRLPGRRGGTQQVGEISRGVALPFSRGGRADGETGECGSPPLARRRRGRRN